MNPYRDNVIVVNVYAPSGAQFCRAKRKKKLGKATHVTTLCGTSVPGTVEMHRPGLALVTCPRCRRLEGEPLKLSNYPVARRQPPR